MKYRKRDIRQRQKDNNYRMDIKGQYVVKIVTEEE